jgi:hypothetical protein
MNASRRSNVNEIAITQARFGEPDDDYDDDELDSEPVPEDPWDDDDTEDQIT